MDEVLICELYESGLSMRRVADKIGCSHSCVSDVLHKYGVKIRNLSQSHQKYAIDENYFETIHSQNRAYFLGFIMADGMVQHTKATGAVHSGVLSIRINQRDDEILKAFKKCIKSTHPLEYYSVTTPYGSCDVVGITIANKKLFHDLLSHGVIPRKSFFKIMPKLCKQAIPHFIRGYFDGDGTITYSNKEHTRFNIKICGTAEILNSIQEFYGIHNTLCGGREDYNNWYLTCEGSTALKILDSMYNNAIIKLSRKYNRYLEIKQRLC